MPDHRDHLQNVSKPVDPTLRQRLSDWVWGRAKTADRTPGPQRLHEVSVSAKRRWLDQPAGLKGGGPYRPLALAGLADELTGLSAADFGVDKTIAQLSGDAAYLFHRVKANESLAKIAKRHYGDAGRAAEIFQANRDSLEHPSEIAAGATIRVPRPMQA